MGALSSKDIEGQDRLENNIRLVHEHDLANRREEIALRPRRRSIRLLLVRHASSVANLSPVVSHVS